MSLKITINNEEVVCNNNIQIKEEMLSTSSTILKNCYPKTWELDKDYVSRYYFPKDYSKCKITNDTYHPEEPGTIVKGSNLNINYNNTKRWELKGLYGNTYQQTYTGKNLCGIPDQTITKNGVTITIKNGEITLNGTSTNSLSYIMPINTTTLSGNYSLNVIYISGSMSGSTNRNFNVRKASDNSNIFGATFQTSNSYNTYNFTNSTEVIFGLYAANTAKFTNYTFKVQLVEGTSSDYNYEPYVGGTSSPNPNYPQPIENVTGFQTIIRCGKNLFNKDNMNTLNAYINGSGIIKTDVNASVLYIPCKPNTSYAIQKPLQTTTSSNRFKVGCCTSIPTIETHLSKYNNLPNGTTNTTMIFETDSTANYLVFNFAGGNQSEYQNVINGIQIEVNNHITSYESYTSQSYEVNLGKNLFNKDNANVVNGYFTPSSTTITADNNHRIIYIPCNSNTTYTIQKSNVGTQSRFGIGTTTSIPEAGTNVNQVARDNTATSQTITTNSTAKYLVVWCYFTGNTEITFDDLLATIQIEKGSTATSYSPYFTPIELNKIGNYEDKIYKQDDKWYIEKNIQKVVITGSTAGIYQSGNLTNVMRMAVPSGYNLGGNSSSLFCDKLKVDVGYNHDYEQIYVSNNNFYVFVAKSRGVTDVNTFKTWLNSNNLNCYVVLSTPTTTEITNEDLLNQLESIYYMNLKNGVNNIISTSENLPILLEIHYNYHEAYTNEDLIFCGCVKNTGKISLNPREPHFVDLQVLDFKTLLSEGETLNYVITGKTIVEAINQVVNSISDYGFIVGNIEILNPNDIINAYSTLNKTAYDVFQYIADITQSRWTTRMIDENTIAIDFYDPTLMPTGTPIESTQAYYENNQIIDISFNYSTNDYRNKQIMTSDEVFANITQTETIIADGYATSFMCENKIGTITSITLNGINQTFITKNEEQLGYSGDFVYQPGENTFISSNSISAGGVIVITYYAIVKGREIIINSSESSRIETQVGRKGIISRYENRNDSTSSVELQKIGQSYIKYKGNAEIQLKVKTKNNLWNVGEILSYNAPLEELSNEYMVKSKEVDWYAASNETFYIYELTSNFNYENAVNYFDNQRAKNQGNIGEGQTISRNIDLESTALIKFYDTAINEVQIQNPTSLDFALDGVLI